MLPVILILVNKDYHSDIPCTKVFKVTGMFTKTNK